MRLTVMRMDLSKDVSIDVVGARELYRLLGLSERFSYWSERNFKKFSAVSGRDYFKKTEDRADSGLGRPRLEYLISLVLARRIVLASESKEAINIDKQLIELEKTEYKKELEYLKREFKEYLIELNLDTAKIYEGRLKKELLLQSRYGI